MKIRAKLRAPRFDKAAYRRQMETELLEVLTQGAFEWLGSATDIVPTWSGASRATFLKLAREIGFQLPVSPTSNAPSRIPLGLQNSEGEFKKSGGYFAFIYRTSLKHLVYNESHNANVDPDPGLLGRLKNPGPYKFQEKSAAVFLRAVSSARLPDPRRFIRAKQVR